jgi:hypothetical protein
VPGPVLSAATGIFSEYEDVDGRYRLRGALASLPRGSAAHVESCFVLGMKPHANPSNPFNVRAWLYYEAGRHADVDLTPLEAHGGMWPVRGHHSYTWWKRAVAHAAGSHPAKFYALALAEPLLELPLAELSSLMGPLLAGEARPDVHWPLTNLSKVVSLYPANQMQSTLQSVGGPARSSRLRLGPVLFGH